MSAPVYSQPTLYLTLGKLKQLAEQYDLTDSAIILSNDGNHIRISTPGELHPELVIGWDDGLPRFWVRQELSL